MIISRTPLRISLLGGGSDFKDYYSNNFGGVISFGIDKYVYCIIKKKYEPEYKVSYSRIEVEDSLNNIKNDIVRESGKMFNLPTGTEISIMMDIPSTGTGLGSSSAISVGLINSMSSYLGLSYDKHSLAQLACKLEIDILKSPIGVQDQFATSFGGLRYYEFTRDNIIECKLPQQLKSIEFLEKHLMLFHFGVRTTSANEILADQSKRTEINRPLLDKMVELIPDMKYHILNQNYLGVADILNQSWELKKNLSSKISNNSIDSFVNNFKDSGALAVKLNGAGNAGFFSVWTDGTLESRDNIINNSNLKHVPYSIDTEGTKIISF